MTDEGESVRSGQEPATGHGRGARGFLRAAAIVAVTLGSLFTVAPSSCLAAPPPGTLLTLAGATIISAVIPLPVNDTYLSLLPSPFAPAAEPTSADDPNRPSMELIGLSLTVPGGETAYENYTVLRASYCGQDGWYNRADGVTSEAIYTAGNSIGIPKYLLDPDSNIYAGAGRRVVWRSRARLDGGSFVTLTWRSNPKKVERLLSRQPWQADWLHGSGQPFKGPIWDTFPMPNEQTGSVAWIDANVPDTSDPPNWKNEVGVVRVKVRQGVSPSRTGGDWMALIPKATTVPGVLQTFDSGTSYVTLQIKGVGDCPSSVSTSGALSTDEPVRSAATVPRRGGG